MQTLSSLHVTPSGSHSWGHSQPEMSHKGQSDSQRLRNNGYFKFKKDLQILARFHASGIWQCHCVINYLVTLHYNPEGWNPSPQCDVNFKTHTTLTFHITEFYTFHDWFRQNGVKQAGMSASPLLILLSSVKPCLSFSEGDCFDALRNQDYPSVT